MAGRLVHIERDGQRAQRPFIMPAILRVIIGGLCGGAFAFGSFLLALSGLGMRSGTAAVVAAVAAGVGIFYGGLAFGNRVYGKSIFAILGFVLDMSWSWLNTLAGLLVWIPACKLAGGSLSVSPESQRSGAFVYDKNPRDPSGVVFGATTIGTVIAGGWSSHEEVHVWQARLFGPFYLITYGVAFLLGAVARAALARQSSVMFEAYQRICWEDWAYWAGKTSGAGISVGGWLGGFALSSVYVGLVACIPIGIASGPWLLSLGGGIGLIAYSVIRSLTPGSA